MSDEARTNTGTEYVQGSCFSGAFCLQVGSPLFPAVLCSCRVLTSAGCLSQPPTSAGFQLNMANGRPWWETEGWEEGRSQSFSSLPSLSWAGTPAAAIPLHEVLPGTQRAFAQGPVTPPPPLPRAFGFLL